MIKTETLAKIQSLGGNVVTLKASNRLFKQLLNDEDVKTYEDFRKNRLNRVFKLTNNSKTINSSKHIIIAGCGGTGSRLAQFIAQHYAYNTRQDEKVSLSFVDNDKIEVKNLKRQNFFDFEVGQYKAEALANRFKFLYKIEAKAYNTDIAQFISDGHTVIKNGNTYPGLLIIFDCLDNRDGRLNIENTLNRHSMILNNQTILIISCGNELDYGQVYFGTYAGNINKYKHSTGNNIHKIISEDVTEITYIPTFMRRYPDLQDSVAPSCANTDQPEQSLAINCSIAQFAFNIFLQLVNNDAIGIDYNMIRYNLNNDFSIDKLTFARLEEFYGRIFYGDKWEEYIFWLGCLLYKADRDQKFSEDIITFINKDKYFYTLEGIIKAMSDKFNEEECNILYPVYQDYISINYR